MRSTPTAASTVVADGTDGTDDTDLPDDEVGAVDDALDAGDDALRLPDPPVVVRRGGVPLLAAALPVVAAVGVWAVTHTTVMLWFAALGPLIAGAGYLDSAVAAHRTRRRAVREAADARRTASGVVSRTHAVERRQLWARHPDVLHHADGTVGDIWRGAPDRGLRIVVGSGTAPSAARVTGGGPDAHALRRRARTVDGAPVTVAVDEGIAVAGPAALSRAVVRSLVLQLCIAVSPDRLVVRAPDDGAPWYDALPHTQGPADTRTLQVCGPGEPPDASADVVIARVRVGDPAPSRCRTMLTLTDVDTAHLVGDGIDTLVRVEGLSAGQAARMAGVLARRAADTLGRTDDAAPVELAGLLRIGMGDVPVGQAASAGRAVPVGGARATASSLPAVIGVSGRTSFTVDLVADGPHAVIAGMTGSGKSELLTTWVTALCSAHPPSRVAFLLADFKGGAAFDALTALPHVTGVITDLDGDGAHRALHSLRAELRHREGEILRAGARDIGGTGLPRLVIVVDEFAALAASHPDLQDLFVDIAARGRALGMHLVLGTQRAAGTFRDALLANCPLRISLRVADPADSRTLLGCDDAARLPGTVSGRGIALVRRAADSRPHAVRIAVASGHLIAQVAEAAPGPRPRRPWLPALPHSLCLDAVRACAADEGEPGDLWLGIADQPDRQRQSAVVLRASERGLCVIGSPGSGRSSVLALVAGQAADPVWVGPDPEQAWDALAALADDPRPGALVLVDDVDALLGRYPADYTQEVVARLERVIHSSGAAGARVVLAAQRLNAATARVADLIPRRALLALPSRSEHVAAGGDAATWRDRLPPGRAVLDGHAVQFALPDVPRVDSASPVEEWMPSAPATGVVLRPGPLRRRIVAAAHDARACVVAVDEASAVLGERARRPRVRADRPVVVIADTEQWQREWRTLTAIRADGELLIDASGTADYRLITGDRELPPYCVPGRGRAWLVRGGEPPRRAIVPGAGPGLGGGVDARADPGVEAVSGVDV